MVDMVKAFIGMRSAKHDLAQHLIDRGSVLEQLVHRQLLLVSVDLSLILGVSPVSSRILVQSVKLEDVQVAGTETRGLGSQDFWECDPQLGRDLVTEVNAGHQVDLPHQACQAGDHVQDGKDERRQCAELHHATGIACIITKAALNTSGVTVIVTAQTSVQIDMRHLLLVSSEGVAKGNLFSPL